MDAKDDAAIRFGKLAREKTMPDQGRNALGQNANAARAHRWLAYLYAVFAVLFFLTGVMEILSFLLHGAPEGILVVLLIAIFLGALAGINYVIAAGALQKKSLARIASVGMAIFLLLIGAFLFWTRPDIRVLINRGDDGAALAAALIGVLVVVHIVAAIYILLNSNWQQPVPPGEGPYSDLEP